MWATKPGVSRLADIKPSKTDCNLLIDLEHDNEAASFFGESGSTDTHLQFANCDLSHVMCHLTYLVISIPCAWHRPIVNNIMIIWVYKLNGTKSYWHLCKNLLRCTCTESKESACSVNTWEYFIHHDMM